ncbi:MAG: helix-turn-helix domain-containing protein [Ruminococcaceae bacterium]|nr:helix-turn-helix domain-containing protein [Oscillospiraceae bacterium]
MEHNLTLYEKPYYNTTDFPIHFGSWIRGSNFSAHWHEHIEFLFFKTDDYVVTSNGISYKTKKNDMMIFNPFDIHSSEVLKDETLFYVITIYPAFFADIDLKNVMFQPHIQNDPVVNRYVEELYVAFQKETDDFGMEKKSIVCRLLSHLFQHYKIEALTENEILARKNQRKKIGEILKYIARNYHEKLTTASLAEEFHMNEQYLCKFFKRKTGKSPTQYINHYRIEKAILFLETSDYSMTEIAFNVGFDDSNYFSRIFKKHIGQTPREYKNNFSKQ